MRNVAIITQPVIQQFVPPPIQEVSPFSSIDWSLIKELDPDVIRRNKDSSKVKDFISAFQTFTINQSDTKSFNNPLSARLFCLLQVSIDYLFHQHHQLIKMVEKKNAKYNRLSKKYKILEESYQKSKELIESLRGSHETCPVCQRRFKGTVYLDNHFRRKHPDLVPAWNSIRTQTPIQTPNVEELLKEIKKLKEAQITQQNTPYIVQNTQPIKQAPQIITYNQIQPKQEIQQQKVQTQPISSTPSEEKLNPFALFAPSDTSTSSGEQHVTKKRDPLNQRQDIPKEEPPKEKPKIEITKPATVVNTKPESDSDELSLPEIEDKKENIIHPITNLVPPPQEQDDIVPPSFVPANKPKNQIATLNKARVFVDKEKSAKANMGTSEFEREIDVVSEQIRRKVAERLQKEKESMQFQKKPQDLPPKDESPKKQPPKPTIYVQPDEDIHRNSSSEEGEFSYESNPFETDYDQQENSFAIEDFVTEEEEPGEIPESDHDEEDNPFVVDKSGTSVNESNPFMVESSSEAIPPTINNPPPQIRNNYSRPKQSPPKPEVNSNYRGLEVSSSLFDDESSTFLAEKAKLLPPQKMQMAPPPKRRLLQLDIPDEDKDDDSTPPPPPPAGLMPRPAGIARAEAARKDNPKLKGFFTENDFLDD
ncbi:hypothetical protein TVAG_211730 [Trichomonas vaginalis G3]|uniref:C2H2-type domain-containing protein n=1 Tax=Trichomonas vaginalis (strain ATCC PRA-98 / G3) TaxID=412133 RepID=A2G088_TRIV3|nr:zinc finger, C2H2-type family protein [Trichomonas vaginalis G3]EAX89423.1 hypothetical protein TVAG_211730 [Trichomonas vaginalis G3]KAI5511341.1 zinc finger, C2H2-type family protein [Trichomonas vaginalis G3]|eukprot:XP_001302353.1 hypothetical protein [Trichomonas vaginalis G3]